MSIGIFPASHIHIREQLGDTDVQLAGADELTETNGHAPKTQRNGRMEPLKEEDEEEAVSPTEAAVDFTSFGMNGGTPSKARNRASVTSFQGSRLSQYGSAQVDAVDARPPPPLPNLKCGDETLAGQTEPLVDEIACAERQWHLLLFQYLSRRDYALFDSVRGHIDALHIGRKQLLLNSLSIDETERLRQDMVERLVKGNIEQGLEVIVRHPLYGGLVDVEVEGEIESKAWATVIRMCECEGTEARPRFGIDFRSQRRHASRACLFWQRRRRTQHPITSDSDRRSLSISRYLTPTVKLQSFGARRCRPSCTTSRQVLSCLAQRPLLRCYPLRARRDSRALFRPLQQERRALCHRRVLHYPQSSRATSQR